MNRLDWKTARSQLALLMRDGKLVPFVGAGMSAPSIPTWRDFLSELATVASVAAPEESSSVSLVRGAQRVARAFRGKGHDQLANAIRTAFSREQRQEITLQTRALARIWWPLIISTNYDDMLARALVEELSELQVKGRSDISCFDVSRSLHTTAPPILWAIQGFVGEPSEKILIEGDLHSEVVLGHAQYREVTYKQPGFRRTFAEVVRARSLLFLGSSLETYLLELLSEVRELHGANHLWHYALVPKGERDKFDPEWFAREYQIHIVEFDDYADVPARIDDLGELQTKICSQVAWTIGRPDGGRVSLRAGEYLPDQLDDDECLVVSAGGTKDGNLFFSSSVERTLKKLGIDDPSALDEWRSLDPKRGHLYESVSRPSVLAARARTDDDRRDLSSVWNATRLIFQKKEAKRYRLQLLASGRGLRREGSFAARHAFTMMLRGIGTAAAGVSVTLHVLERSITEELRRNRLSLEEHLSSKDIRFWVSVAYDAIRRPCSRGCHSNRRRVGTNPGSSS